MIKGFKGSSEMRKFKLNSEFRLWRFRIGHSELRTSNSELLLRNRGFTLIEIIVLVVLAGIIIPVIVVPFATGIRGSNKPEMVTKAMYFAHQRMEELMKFDYGNGVLTPAGVVAFATGDVNYPGENEIVYVDSNFSTPSGDVGYKRIRVRVTDPETNTYEVYSVVTNFP
jgi:type II secretory pathway pseudopilin PulG